ncbi:DUF1616 domain-containing protein [uncultured Methanolobus sp.]|uniref:DUF1616 domain-containing protein n=1 Tax=uncultured Methanolobus sp. TaxID=218300 RepID=UPI002AABA5C3|nr:DUF1616 domain-containing protein [uncultured Methanolobus sp.]
MPEKKHTPTDIKLVIALVLLTDIFVLIPFLNDSPIRTVLGLPMVLFLPGYALIAALFPGKDDLDGIERIALSFGLSIAVVPLIGLILNYTPWGIRLVPILVFLTNFTILMSIVAIYRREALGNNAFSVPFREMYESVIAEINEKPESQLDQILTIVLMISILLSAITLAYVVITPKQGEKFTEFYILGPERMADNYKTHLELGESVYVIAGIVNHEYSVVNYSIVIRLNNETIETPPSLNHIALAHNVTWEKPVSFIPGVPGEDMKLEYLLYREDNMTEPYRDLHLWINVTEAAE